MISALFREEVDDAVNGLVRAVCMQGAQAQVASFGECDCMFHGFGVANLADQDYVRRLAQGVFQGVVPRQRIDADFTMRDQAGFILVHIFDRIFHRDDVAVRIAVAMIDHRGQRG